MNATGDSNRVAIKAATEALTGMISNLATALTMWIGISDKNINMIVPINKAVLVVKSSDTRLCGGESHIRVKKMSAASDSTNAAIKAATERFTGMISTLTPALTMWTTVSVNINAQSKPVLAVKSSDTSLCRGGSHLRSKTTGAANYRTKAATRAATETLTGMISTLTPALTMLTAVPDKNKTNMNSTPIHSCKR